MIVRNRRAQSLRARILRVLSVLAILVLALVVSYRLGARRMESVMVGFQDEREVVAATAVFEACHSR